MSTDATWVSIKHKQPPGFRPVAAVSGVGVYYASMNLALLCCPLPLRALDKGPAETGPCDRRFSLLCWLRSGDLGLSPERTMLPHRSVTPGLIDLRHIVAMYGKMSTIKYDKNRRVGKMSLTSRILGLQYTMHEEEIMDSKTFAKNLSHLLSAAKLKKKEAAEKLGINYPWLRRAGTEGVGRPDPRNRETLDKIVVYFCLSSDEDLWREDLPGRLLGSPEYQAYRDKFFPGMIPEPRPGAASSQGPKEAVTIQPDEKALLSALTQLLAGKAVAATADVPAISGVLSGTYGEKVQFLLGTGQHEYLKKLIDDLLWSHVQSQPHAQSKMRVSS